MKPLRLFAFFLTFLLFSKIIYGSDEIAVGRVVLSKGDVTAIREGAEEELFLLSGDFVYENDLIRTSSYSLIKLKFIKNGNLMLGPNSEVRLQKFKKNKPGLISLLKGQLRSQVKKEADKSLLTKEKFLIRTKSSALGVRGTDFELRYDPALDASTLVVHKGLVAMSAYFHDSNNVDLLLNHFNYGEQVIEVPDGFGLEIGSAGIKSFELQEFKELSVDTEPRWEKPVSRQVKVRHPSQNVTEAMKNAELNTSGAVQNGL